MTEIDSGVGGELKVQETGGLGIRTSPPERQERGARLMGSAELSVETGSVHSF